MKVKRIRLNFKNYIIFNLILILFLMFLFFIIFSKKIIPKLTNISNVTIKKKIYENINDIHKNLSENSLFKTVLNSDGEIIYIDYDLTKAYKIVDNVNNMLEKDDDMIISLPYFLKNSNYYLANLGPKIKVKIAFIKVYITKIYTKVTDYGLNNALLEIYLKIDVQSNIIAPFVNDKQSISYDLLLASKVVSGRVPSLITK